jgi:hypothetical protein
VNTVRKFSAQRKLASEPLEPLTVCQRVKGDPAPWGSHFTVGVSKHAANVRFTETMTCAMNGAIWMCA